MDGRDRGELPAADSVLAVCAHPDDESFGLGALLYAFASAGADVAVLCFTHGEASSLGEPAADLRDVRGAELTAAADVLGVGRVALFDHPDGALASVALETLAAHVAVLADEVDADLVVVFDVGGVTGHPDHVRATEAALAGSSGRPVLAWVVPRRVASALNAQFGTTFDGRPDDEVDVVASVDRNVQHRAIRCHASQSADNPVLWRRLELLGDEETLRWLRRPEAAAPGTYEPG